MPLTAEILKKFDERIELGKNEMVFKGEGCEDCNFTGYSGRQAIYEFLLVNESLRQLIMTHATSSQIKERAVANGMKTLRQSGWEKVKKGVTTLEEVIRVTKEENT